MAGLYKALPRTAERAERAEKAVILEELQRVTHQRDRLEAALQHRTETEFVTLVRELLDDRLRQLENNLAALLLSAEGRAELTPIKENGSVISLQPPFSIEVAKRLFSGATSEVNGHNRMWRYIDLEGKLQGPFPGPLMTRWYSSGHFRNPQLMVCCTVPNIDNQQLDVRLHFLKLGQLLKMCEAGEAFHPLRAEDLLSGLAIAPATPDRMLERRGSLRTRFPSCSSDSATSSNQQPGRLNRRWSGGDDGLSQEDALASGSRLIRYYSMNDSPSASAGHQQTSRGPAGGRVSFEEHQLAVATVQQAGLEAVAALDAAAMRAVTAKKEDMGLLLEELAAIRARLDLAPSMVASPPPNATCHDRTLPLTQNPSPALHHIPAAAPPTASQIPHCKHPSPSSSTSSIPNCRSGPLLASSTRPARDTDAGPTDGRVFVQKKMTWEANMVDGKLVWSAQFLESSRTKRIIKRIALWAKRHL